MSRLGRDKVCGLRRDRRAAAAGGGFTLIEMLVVVAIIAVLAGLLVPAVMKARRKGVQTDCANNLHQFSVSCHLYRMHHNDQWPGWLSNLYPIYIDDTIIYVCGADFRRGASGGKIPELSEYGDTDDFSETDDTASNPKTGFASPRNDSVAACSYFYELPAVTCDWWPGFFPNKSDGTPVVALDVDRNGDGNVTWGEVKIYQLAHGDIHNGGEAYNEIYFPVIRCFHHHSDTIFYVDHTASGGGENDAEGMTLNVAHAGNVFYAPITWELTPK